MARSSKGWTYTTRDEEAVGSSLLGQNFSAGAVFSSPTVGPQVRVTMPLIPAARISGPLSDKLLNGLVNTDDKGVKTLAFDGIRLRTLHYAMDNGIRFKTDLPLDPFKDKDANLDDVKLVDAFHDANMPLVLTDFSTLIPGDAVTASGSGLDPHISPRNAELQTARVAQVRGIRKEQVEELIDAHNRPPGSWDTR